MTRPWSQTEIVLIMIDSIRKRLEVPLVCAGALAFVAFVAFVSRQCYRTVDFGAFLMGK